MCIRLFISVIVCAMLFTGCDESSDQVPVQAPSAESAYAAVATQAATSESVIAEQILTLEQKAWAQIAAGDILIDVRTQEEYDQGHLDNALLIPHGSILAGVKKAGIKVDQAIVVYCRSGGRSGQAMQDLKAAGYVTVMNAGAYEKIRAAKPVAAK